MKSNKLEWFAYKDSNVYDGYILEFNVNGDIRWRKQWFVDQLTDQQKEEISKKVFKVIENIKQLQKEGY